MNKLGAYFWTILLKLAYYLTVIGGRGLAYIIYLLLSRILRYRVKVIDHNLLLTGLADGSTLSLYRQSYYRQLATYVVEIIYCLHAPADVLLRRVNFTNVYVLEKMLSSGKSVIVMASHYGNWEWVNVLLKTQFNHPVVAVYKPLSDKGLDEVMYRCRARFGVELASMGEVIKHIKTHKEATVYLLISDQSPAKPEPVDSVTSFFGVDTHFFSGPKKLSTRFDMGVFYQAIRPTAAGFDVSFLELNAAELPAPYAKSLEADIRIAPQYWLWSHNRWKHNT